MASALAGLCADEVAADVDGLLDVLWVADHVHDGDACGVQAVDSLARGNADCGDEEGGLFGDDDVDELGKLALCVVVLDGGGSNNEGEISVWY